MAHGEDCLRGKPDDERAARVPQPTGRSIICRVRCESVASDDKVLSD